MYECLLRSRKTGELQQVTAIRLTVMAAPRISLRPATQTVQPGQSPTVECVVSGDDIRDITWIPVNRQPSRFFTILNYHAFKRYFSRKQ